MKIQIGAGNTRLHGFLNVDVRRLPTTDVRGHAGSLRTIQSGTVDVIYCNALFEHIYLAQHLMVLEEWKRVLSPQGILVCTGIPDFETIARLYLERAPGLISPDFDLYHVYRYTHGLPEQWATANWHKWDPARCADGAPAGYIPQLHKSLFDAPYLRSLLRQVGLEGAIFRYCFPNEKYPLNLGFLVSPSATRVNASDKASLRAGLEQAVDLSSFVDLETVRLSDDVDGSKGLLEVSRHYFGRRPPTLVSRFFAKLRHLRNGQRKRIGI